MTKKRLLFYLFYLSSLLGTAQDMQQNFLDSLSGKVISDIRKQSRPKAWLVTDKSVYKAGEPVWFRAHLLNSVSRKIIHLNTFFFVDVVNEKDSVISTALLDGASQQLSSKITLPSNIPAGYYWLRAYTSQIAAVDTNNAFVQTIYVADAKGKISPGISNANAASDTGQPIMQFYPEGGNIITGANSTVAFVINDAYGKPVATDGYIKDTRDSIVARFSTNDNGLGRFDIYASSFRKYKAFINWRGKQVSYPLPAFNFRAGQVAVTKQGDGNTSLRVLLEDSIYKKILSLTL